MGVSETTDWSIWLTSNYRHALLVLLLCITGLSGVARRRGQASVSAEPLTQMNKDDKNRAIWVNKYIRCIAVERQAGRNDARCRRTSGHPGFHKAWEVRDTAGNKHKVVWNRADSTKR